LAVSYMIFYATLPGFTELLDEMVT